MIHTITKQHAWCQNSLGQYIGHLRCFQSLPSTIYALTIYIQEPSRRSPYNVKEHSTCKSAKYTTASTIIISKELNWIIL